MKKLMLVLLVLLVIGIMVTGGCVGSNTTAPNQTLTQIIENVTPPEAFTLIQDNENNPEFVILDVRTLEEFDDGHIEDAINLDYYSDTFRGELNKLDKDKKYLIYCRSGNRSGKALNIMEKLSFREVYNMSGGILEWEAEGLPTTK